jgi:outer membrane protein assembly factor BamB
VKKRLSTVVAILAVILIAIHSPAADVLKSSGVQGGLVVVLGCDDIDEIAGSAGDRYIVQALGKSAAEVSKAREQIRAMGKYGKVSVVQWDGAALPYVDNLVNLLVDKNGQISKEEATRVLAPRGVALIKGQKTVKPVPADIDSWTHYLHGPDNNAVANDLKVGPPKHMQWLAGPRWTRTHHKLNSISSIATENGRLFYIVDTATSASMSVPGKWRIIARDAFNGVELWRKKIESWVPHTIGFRSGPPHVTRLLVASNDRIYAPLAKGAPISAIDAATGETLKAYECTAGTREMILAGDVLLTQLAGSIVAANVDSGSKLWEWSSPSTLMPETMASDGKQVYVQVNQSVICLDLNSGKEAWRFGDPVTKKSALRGFGKYVLVVSDGVVLCNLSQKLTAISAKDGEKIWETKGGGGFHAPMDVFVIDGVAWTGDHPRDSVAPPPVNDFSRGYSLQTGAVIGENTVMVDLQTAGHHHRCYREKATSRYIIGGKRGFEMMDLKDDNHARANWVRGTCQYGMLPANGLTYAPSHSCGCYPESKLWGFYALNSEQPSIEKTISGIEPSARLQKGNAYGKLTSGLRSPASASWPQMRHDALRSGVSATTVPASLKQRWKIETGEKVTQPVVGEGRVVFAAIDENTIYAADEKTGKFVWQRTVGGRVDSPPAIYKGTVLFGCADGRVYCLRLSDGELAWSFLAAPADIRTVALEQVESLWPVHGSVLVLNDVLYCAAGRSTWLDKGIEMYGLDPATGKVIHNYHYESRHPKLNEGKNEAKPEHNKGKSQTRTDYRTFLQPDKADSFSMAGGSIRDVLVSDGRNVFMHHATFNAQLKPQKKMARHFFSTSGLLDGAENHRSHWVMGSGDFSMVSVAYSWIVNGGGWGGASAQFGLMMAYDDKNLWVVRRKGYSLFKKPNKPFSDEEESVNDFAKRKKGNQKGSASKDYSWNVKLGARPRALIKAGDNLFLGTIPSAKGDDPHAAYEGRVNGMITVVSDKDGQKVAEHKLDAPVKWDGMAAANGKLFVALENGNVECWAGE